MKNYIFLVVTCIVIAGCKSSGYTANNSENEQPCTVKIANLTGTYSGGCKKGLANGNGNAVGKDTYKGHFKMGLPDGKGTYTWASGATYTGEWKKGKRNGKGIYTFAVNGRDSVMNGYWGKGKFLGTHKPKPPYKINNQYSIASISITKLSDNGNDIHLQFRQNGSDSKSDVSNLLLNGSSGSYNNSLTSNYLGFQDVTFPFKGFVDYYIPNSMKSSSMECKLTFTINQPGTWRVTLNN